MTKIKNLLNWNVMDFLSILFGSLLFAIAINVFIVPNNLYSGGILGLSQLIRSFIIDSFHLKITYDFSGLIYYLINIPLFIIAYKKISKTFFIRTIFTVSLQALLLSLVPTQAIINDMITSVLVGGILAGLGNGIVLSSGGSGGGTDIIGIALASKINNLSVGKIGLFINALIYGVAGLLYGLEIMIYSIIYSAIDSLTVDKTHKQNICSTAFIFCKKNPKKVNDFIKNELNRDFTYWDAKGGYNDSKTYIIYTAMTKYELIRLEKFLKIYEPNAFMIKSEGVSIKGEFVKTF